eukprot:Gb_03284 [translate_table: standard]
MSITTISHDISELTKLKHLHLGGNYFNRSIPPEYGKWESLEFLTVSRKELSGKVRGEESSVSTLFLQVNSLSGPIPPELANLKSLKSMDLSNNELTGETGFEIDESFRRICKAQGDDPLQSFQEQASWCYFFLH